MKTKTIEILAEKLNKINNELEKVRGCSPLTHGWQTQKLAKAQRNWDYWSSEKRKITQQMSELCNGECPCCSDSLSCNIFKWK